MRGRFMVSLPAARRDALRWTRRLSAEVCIFIEPRFSTARATPREGNYVWRPTHAQACPCACAFT